MSTIAEKLQIIIDSKAAIKQAILDKGGEVGDLTTYAQAIANLPSGGGDVNPTAEKNDVTFYDYDGTIRYSYTAEEFLALTEMPPLPTQKGLICQEWNWSFEDAREYVAEYGILDVGATYITDDGKTRLYIHIAAEGRMSVPLYFSQTVANGVTIDWGDGSAVETLDSTGKVNTTHRYASIGDYIITLDATEGCDLKLGYGESGYCVMGSTDNNGKVYCNMLQKIEIGAGVKTIALAAFNFCSSLASVVIPNSVTDIKDTAFSNCSFLFFIVLPQNITRFGSNLFCACVTMTSVAIPKLQNHLPYAAFYNCNSLSHIVIPYFIGNNSNVFSNCTSLSSIVLTKETQTIPGSTFSNCCGMAFYDFSHHTAVPTLVSTAAFVGIPTDCKIIVPDALYDEWVAATNWSAYSSYIIKKTDWDASKNNQ